jgi:hypothetical protein
MAPRLTFGLLGANSVIASTKRLVDRTVTQNSALPESRDDFGGIALFDRNPAAVGFADPDYG